MRFIVNSRSGRAAQALPAVRAFASEHGADVVLTQRPAHGGALAVQALAEGCELIVAVGGDGTMNEVASALLGTSGTLGLVPCGSGDGLGRHLKIHGSPARALDILAHGRPRLIDSGTADGHPFFTAAGLGFEAEIADRFNRLLRRGFLRSLTTSAALLREWEAEPCRIVHEGGEMSLRAFTLVVANADQYGNGARIAPLARADDGKLNLTVIPPVRSVDSVALLLRLFSGRIGQAGGVTLREGTRFTVHRTKPGLIHTDGEIHHAGATVEFVIRPGSLRIMTPISA